MNDSPSTPALPSFHDYLLTGHAVDGERKTISFTVRWPHGEIAVDIRRASITFSGVAAYFFEHDLGQNILYAIEEFPLAQCLNEQAAFFDAQKRHGWPPLLARRPRSGLGHADAARRAGF